MNSREILEFCARAMRFEKYRWLENEEYPSGVFQIYRDCWYWNWDPLVSNGDCLSLAVKTYTSVEFTCCAEDSPIVGAGNIIDRENWNFRSLAGHSEKETRYAICRAVAEEQKLLEESLEFLKGKENNAYTN